MSSSTLTARLPIALCNARSYPALMRTPAARTTLRMAYADCYDSDQETSGALLDYYSAAPVLTIRGGRTPISWDRLVLCELVEG